MDKQIGYDSSKKKQPLKTVFDMKTQKDFRVCDIRLCLLFQKASL